jgi:YggT family protein
MEIVQGVICAVVTIYFVIMLLRIILSWVPSVPDPVRPLARGLRALTDPVLIPLRGTIPPVRVGVGALDLSPLLVFVALMILRALLC